jgi:hypothetical protein
MDFILIRWYLIMLRVYTYLKVTCLFVFLYTLNFSFAYANCGFILNKVLEDMAMPHDELPHGVPSNYSWYYKPRVAAGNDPKGFDFFTAWGMLYRSEMNKSSTNARVQIKNIKSYLFDLKFNRWISVQNDVRMYGASFREDFKDNFSKPADFDVNQNSISIRPENGFNIHFWKRSRENISIYDVGGFFLYTKVRLVGGSINDASDRYILSVGADYWKKRHSFWKQDWSENKDIAIGRFNLIDRNWKVVGMTTMTATQLAINPPPIDIEDCNH